MIFLLLHPAVRQQEAQLHMVEYLIYYGEDILFNVPFNYRLKMLLNFDNLFFHSWIILFYITFLVCWCIIANGQIWFILTVFPPGVYSNVDMCFCIKIGWGYMNDSLCKIKDKCLSSKNQATLSLLIQIKQSNILYEDGVIKKEKLISVKQKYFESRFFWWNFLYTKLCLLRQ